VLLAKAHRWTCVSNDGRLRRACADDGIEVLWVGAVAAGGSKEKARIATPIDLDLEHDLDVAVHLVGHEDAAELPGRLAADQRPIFKTSNRDPDRGGWSCCAASRSGQSRCPSVRSKVLEQPPETRPSDCRRRQGRPSHSGGALAGSGSHEACRMMPLRPLHAKHFGRLVDERRAQTPGESLGDQARFARRGYIGDGLGCDARAPLACGMRARQRT